MRSGAALALSLAALAWAPLALGQRIPIPPHPKAPLFGNLLIDRTTSGGPVKPASFSHWSHRLRYTCRVCHLELEFALKRNGTEITEEANRKGRFCGACHDGNTAFGRDEASCGRCHTGDVETGKAGFSKLKGLPAAKFGNGVDWSAALASGKIAPVASLVEGLQPMSLETTLTLPAELAGIPPAVFPHAIHARWLDCANCHPDVFNIRKKTTKHFSMGAILQGQFCGACHLSVAFPLDDCKRCHPAMKG